MLQGLRAFARGCAAAHRPLLLGGVWPPQLGAAQPPQLAPPVQQRTAATSLPSPSKLGEVIQLELLEGKSADEVEGIWMQHHAEGPAAAHRVASAMTAGEYSQFAARARASPLFVLPIGKGAGSFLTMVLQVQLPFVAFTTLEEFRAMGGAAPPHLTLTHYPELAESKGLVLVRGDVINPAATSVAEARTLMELTRAFYTDPQAHQHVYRFNHQQGDFDFQALLRELGHTPAAA